MCNFILFYFIIIYFIFFYFIPFYLCNFILFFLCNRQRELQERNMHCDNKLNEVGKTVHAILIYRIVCTSLFVLHSFLTNFRTIFNFFDLIYTCELFFNISQCCDRIISVIIVTVLVIIVTVLVLLYNTNSSISILNSTPQHSNIISSPAPPIISFTI